MITIEQQPYAWSARGQKLIYRASSNMTAQTGFKYLVTVTDVFTNVQYNFTYDPDANDEKLYFDLQPLVKLRNWENESGKSIVPHYSPFNSFTEEPEPYGYRRYDVTVSEGWTVAGVFTENVEGAADAERIYVFNAYLQPFYGFRPSPEYNSNIATVYSLYDFNYVWSDRFKFTHNWDYYDTFSHILSPDSIFIPAFNSDWGAVGLGAYTNGPLDNNDVRKCRVTVWYNNTSLTQTYTETLVFTSGDLYPFIHMGIYPQNLKVSGSGVPDVTALDWDFYEVVFLTNDDGYASVPYVIYNATKYGQHDCKNDIIRIAWVSMRGGWDYFNFIKRSEITNQVDRKQFTRRLNNNSSGIFYSNQRQTIDTLNITERTLTVTSDWIQENEFIYLKNLFNSNQVHWLTKTTVYPVRSSVAAYNPEQAVPVSLVDTSFIEQRGRNGKLVNVTLKFKITQNYWT